MERIFYRLLIDVKLNGVNNNRLPSLLKISYCLTISNQNRGNQQNGFWLARMNLATYFDPSIGQSKRGNQRNCLWLAHENLATHFDRSKTVGFYFSWRVSFGPFGRIFDRKVREEAWIFRHFSCEAWKGSNAIFWGKMTLANSGCQRLFNHGFRFCQVFQYIAMAQANGKSNTSTIQKKQSVTHKECVGSLCSDCIK